MGSSAHPMIGYCGSSLDKVVRFHRHTTLSMVRVSAAWLPQFVAKIDDVEFLIA